MRATEEPGSGARSARHRSRRRGGRPSRPSTRPPWPVSRRPGRPPARGCRPGTVQGYDARGTADLSVTFGPLAVSVDRDVDVGEPVLLLGCRAARLIRLAGATGENAADGLVELRVDSAQGLAVEVARRHRGPFEGQAREDRPLVPERDDAAGRRVALGLHASVTVARAEDLTGLGGVGLDGAGEDVDARVRGPVRRRLAAAAGRHALE